MTATTGVSPEVAAYLAAVREALSDLPEAERDDVLADVEASLVEAASESDAPISARLGQPEEFAAELRSAAGLHAPAAPAPATGAVLDRVLAGARRAFTSSEARAVRRAAHELAPIWWVARGYVAVAATALFLDADWVYAYPAVPRLGSPQSGAAAVALAVVVSVAIGLWSRRRPAARSLAVVANAVLVLAALPVLDHLSDVRPTMVVYTPIAVEAEGGVGLTYDGDPVTNVYPYSRDGRLLHDVLLYDGAGRPLEVGVAAADPQRRVVRTQAGKPVWHAFPIRYYEAGTRVVARPNAAPPIRPPRVATPPLRVGREQRR